MAPPFCDCRAVNTTGIGLQVFCGGPAGRARAAVGQGQPGRAALEGCGAGWQGVLAGLAGSLPGRGWPGRGGRLGQGCEPRLARPAL